MQFGQGEVEDSGGRQGPMALARTWAYLNPNCNLDLSVSPYNVERPAEDCWTHYPRSAWHILKEAYADSIMRFGIDNFGKIGGANGTEYLGTSCHKT